jgi:transposase-like protein
MEKVDHKKRRRFYGAQDKEEFLKKIIHLYERGYSQNDISRKINIPRGTISRWLMDIGYKGREPGQAGKVKSKK